jgi:hypothetical protein
MDFTKLLKSAHQIATASVTLWPIVRSLVQAAEQTFPGTKRGADKLDAVLAGVQTAIDVEQNLASVVGGLDSNILKATVTSLANRAVAMDINAPKVSVTVAAPPQ